MRIADHPKKLGLLLLPLVPLTAFGIVEIVDRATTEHCACSAESRVEHVEQRVTPPPPPAPTPSPTPSPAPPA